MSPFFDPMACPRCCDTMRVVAFLTEPAVVYRIINHLKLTLVAKRPPSSRVAYQEYLMDVDPQVDYFS